MSWTDERISTLKKMWLQGKSASEIAEKLGGVTRNAVIGKAHRLNLSGRPSPIKKVVKKAAAPVTEAPAKKAPPAKPIDEVVPTQKPLPAAKAPSAAPVVPPSIPAKAVAVPQPQQQQRSSGNGPGKPPEIVQLAALANASSKADGSIISILELNERLCRWPVGDPRDAVFGYCGNDVYQAHPYCAEHVAIAFQAPNRKDKRVVKHTKESDAPELEDLEIEVEVEDDEAIDDTLEDDLDDDAAVGV